MGQGQLLPSPSQTSRKDWGCSQLRHNTEQFQVRWVEPLPCINPTHLISSHSHMKEFEAESCPYLEANMVYRTEIKQADCYFISVLDLHTLS